MTVYIKCKHQSEKRWSFLTSWCGTTFKRIHAGTFTLENAKKLIADNAADNPEFSWKIVDSTGKVIA